MTKRKPNPLPIGRPPITPGGMVRHTITLPTEQWAHIDAQAGRNRSERARVVVGEHMEAADLARYLREGEQERLRFSIGEVGE